MRLLAIALGWCTGLIWSVSHPFPLGVALLGLAACLAVGFLGRRHRLLVLGIILLAGLCAGALRGGLSAEPSRPHIADFNGQHGELNGVVRSTPSSHGATVHFFLDAEGARINGVALPVQGLVDVLARRPAQLPEIGDRVSLGGAFEAPDAADAAHFVAGVETTVAFPALSLDRSRQGPFGRGLNRVRTQLSAALHRLLPEPQDSIAQALVLGIRTDLPLDVRHDFNASGTTHLLSVSGLHVSVILGLFVLLMKPWTPRPRFLRFLLPVGAIWLFAVLTGFGLPAERAALMGTLYLTATWLGRQRNGIDVLVLAALGITAFDPSALSAVSFQLSFLAMLGIVGMLPTAERLLEAQGLPYNFWERLLRGFVLSVLLSLAATVITLPVVAHSFGTLSLVSIPATVLVLPVLPLVLGSALLAGVIGILSPSAAWIFGWVTWLSLSYLYWVVQHFAAIPGGYLHLAAPLRTALWGIYGLLILGWWQRRTLRERLQPHLVGMRKRVAALPQPNRTRAAFAGLALATGLVWLPHVPRTADLQVVFLDVGGGSATLVHTPSGQTALIDGGSDPVLLQEALGRYLGLRKRIDLLVITNPKQDHVAGLVTLFQRYRVAAILDYGPGYQSATYREVERQIQASGAVRIAAKRGQAIRLGQVQVEVLNPEAQSNARADEVDAHSTVLEVRYQDVSFLLASRADLAAVAPTNPAVPRQVAMLALPSRASVEEARQFIDLLHPSMVVYTGESNLSGEQRVSSTTAGEIEFHSNGRRLWLRTERALPSTSSLTPPTLPR